MKLNDESKKRLENLASIGQLKFEPVDRTEFDGLLNSARPRLADSENKNLNLESRFDLAYNAAHSLGLAALRFHNYRSENRHTAFQALSDTLAISKIETRILVDVHRKRNNILYSGDADVDEATVNKLIEIAHVLLEKLEELDWGSKK